MDVELLAANRVLCVHTHNFAVVVVQHTDSLHVARNQAAQFIGFLNVLDDQAGVVVDKVEVDAATLEVLGLQAGLTLKHLIL